MTKVNLKDNIFIEGFDTQTGVDLELLSDNKSFLRDCVFDEFNSNLLYAGETSEIPEDLAEKCVIQFGLCKGTQIDDGSILQEDIYFGFKNYKPGFGVVDFETPKESIQSACDKEYCIIYKIA